MGPPNYNLDRGVVRNILQLWGPNILQRGPKYFTTWDHIFYNRWVRGQGYRGQGSRVKGQGSGVKGQGSGGRDQGSGVMGQGSRVKGQGSGFKGQGSRV